MLISSVRGIQLGIAAAFLWAISGVLGTFAFRAQPELDSLMAAAYRTVINLWFVITLHQMKTRSLSLPTSPQSGPLLLWGALGAVTIVTFFESLKRIGVSEAIFLQGIQGIVVGLLGPLIFGKKVSPFSGLAIALSFIGITLIFGAEVSTGNISGKFFALASGLSAGLAYLVLVKKCAQASAATVGFYWSLISTFAIGLLLASGKFDWSVSFYASLWLIGSALLATTAQILTTIAFQRAPAPLVAATAYLAPVFGLAWELSTGIKNATPVLVAGGLIAAIGGMAIPLLGARKEKSPPAFAASGPV